GEREAADHADTDHDTATDGTHRERQHGAHDEEGTAPHPVEASHGRRGGTHDSNLDDASGCGIPPFPVCMYSANTYSACRGATHVGATESAGDSRSGPVLRVSVAQRVRPPHRIDVASECRPDLQHARPPRARRPGR